MNLADAIRQAAGGHPIVATPDQAAPNSQPRDFVAPGESVVASTPPVHPRPAPTSSGEEVPISVASTGNAVRLELFLSADQMSGLLRAIAAGHHSVMTLREAASYLRIQSSSLEKMAQEGEIPAFTIDGRWRFPKQALDEWLSLQAFRPSEDAENVA